MKIRWFIGAVLIFILVCSACTAATVDERVSNVQQKLGLTDVKTAYLKQVLLEPIGNGLTRLDEAELLVQVAQQNAAIINQEYFDMVNYWLDYITGKTVGGVQDMACTLLGIGPVCDLIGNLETMRDISKNTHPALVLWNQIITRATIANYLELVTNSSDAEDQEVWNEIIEPGIANQLAGYYDVGSDGKTNGEALHEYCRKVWLADENLKAAQARIDEFKSYIRSRTKGEAIIKITPTGSSTPITSAYAPCRVTFDGSASHATAGHSYTLQWTPTGSSAATLDRYYSTPGHYTVSLLVTQDDGWSWSTSVDFVVRSPRIIVAPDAVDYHKFTFSTDESTDITAYSWNFGDGTPVSNLAAPAHTYATDGDYTVSLTITTSSGNLSVSKSIHVGRTGPTRITVGTITGDEVWNEGGSPYLITSTLTIAQDASLTIGPNVVVKLASGTSLNVYGSLAAQGQNQREIYFTSYRDDHLGGNTGGSNAAKGDWGRIWVAGYGGFAPSEITNGTLTLDHCVLRYGGNSSPMVMANGYNYWILGRGTQWGAGPIVSVSNTEISHSASGGIGYDVTDGSGPNPMSITGCTIADCSGVGVSISDCNSSALSGLDVSGCTSSGISISGGAQSLSNCVVSSSGSTGINLASGTVNSLASIGVSGSNGYPIFFDGCTLRTSLSGLTTSGNRIAGVGLQNCTVAVDSTWDAIAGVNAYVLTGNTTIPLGAKLTIPPGALIKAWNTASVSVYGTLDARGTAQQPIYFTSFKDDSIGGDTNGDGSTSAPVKGDWGRIWVAGYGGFAPSEITNGTLTLDHCVLRYGGNSSPMVMANGYNYWILGRGTQWGAGPIVSVSNTEISHSASGGIGYDVTDGSGPNPMSITGCTIADCSGVGVSISDCNSICLRNCIITYSSTGVALSGIGSTSITYCSTFGNTISNYSGVSAGIGCISADPRFVSPTNYQLQLGSPCIDTGDPSLFDPDGTRSDMGAYRFADHTPPGSGDAKSKDSGQPVSLGTMYVTAAFDGFFYVENQNRSSGIRIEKPGHSFSAGTIVNISGTSGEAANGERCVMADTITPIGSGTVGALGITNRALASGAFGYQSSSWQWQWIDDPTDSITDYRQRKVVDGKIMKECWRPCAGLNTTGLLVRTWGKVADPDPVNHVFYIDDGSALANYDGTRHGMKVVWNGNLPAAGTNAIVTGAMSCEWDATCPGDLKALLPVILATSVGTP